jgi:hypothetical protein
VGVGDIGAVQGGAIGSGYAACGDDGKGAVGQRDCGILDGHWQFERDEGIQQGGDRVGISDGARVRFGGFQFYGKCADRTDGMRGDRVGVTDIGAVQGGAWGWWDVACGDDGWGEGRERDTGMVGGLGRGEHGA